MKCARLIAIASLSFAGQGALAQAHASGFEPYNEPLANTEAALSGAMFTNTTEILTPRGIIDTPAPVFKLIQELPDPSFNSVDANLPPEAAIEPAAGPESSVGSTLIPATELPNATAGHHPNLAPGQ